MEKNQKLEQFKKRLKSLVWRIADMALVFAVAFAIEELGNLEVDGAVKVLVGLLVGELSKWLNGINNGK